MIGGSERISPTAHYTGYVWARNGLSHSELQTLEGRVLYEALRPAMAASAALGGPLLERYLLARHRQIDRRLEAAITAGTVSQVIEVACGLSPRGWRFSRIHGDRITYLEADLPAMAARKRRALERIGSLGDHHRVVEIDALADTGAVSLGTLAAGLEPERGTAIITEGLLGYLDSRSVAAVWRRFAAALHGFPAGLYLSDLHLGEGQTPLVAGFRLLLAGFVRGGVHLHFDDRAAARTALIGAGFDAATVTPAAAGELVHIIEASTVRPTSR
jgi:O-methyltransferase involved in polyketide biosynthesis